MNEQQREKSRLTELDAIPKGPKPCDSGCGKPATQWFGGTSCATCGDDKCVSWMRRDYEAHRRSMDDE